MTLVKVHTTIDELRRKGIPIVPANKYIPASLFPKKVISLAEVRRRLSQIKGNLSETIAEMREEE